MATDLALAYTTLSGKQHAYDRAWRYYDGNQPQTYSTERLRQVFNDLNANFVQNWCAVVINAVRERVALTGFQVAHDQAATQALTALFVASELGLDADDAHLAALVTGEAFVIVWSDEGEAPQAYYNDPRLCAVFYDAENPRVKRFAVKWWLDDDDERRYITLYYPDHLEYYASAGKAGTASDASAFLALDPPTAPNPYGEIPVFHLRRERRAIISELANVFSPQDAVNKLLADMMVAAEFGAFKQRYIISTADTSNMKNSPGSVWDLAAGDGSGQGTQAGEFTATDLSNYLAAIDKLATAIAIITSTPKHFLFAQGGDPSGEALIAMEAPLNKKATHYVARFGVVWQQVAAFLARLSGLTIAAEQITPVFERVETVQPRTAAEIVQLSTAAGMPLVTALRRAGWTEAELQQLEQDQQAAADKQQTTLAQALLQAQRQFDQGGPPLPPNSGGNDGAQNQRQTEGQSTPGRLASGTQVGAQTGEDSGRYGPAYTGDKR